MRVLMLNYEFPPLGGGASPVTRDIAVELVEHGVEVNVVTMGYGDLPRVEDDNGVTVYRIPCLRSKKESSNVIEMGTYLPPALLKAHELLRASNYDIIHSHFIVPTGIVGTLLRSMYDIPHVITSHGSDVPSYNPDRLGYAHKLIRPVSRTIARNADRITTPSNFLKELAAKEYDISSPDIDVIPYGFHEDAIMPASEKDDQIFMASRLLERKGFQYVFRALAQIDCEYSVKVAGEGPYKDDLVGLAEDLDIDVTFAGWLEGEELYAEYGNSEIFVLPSASDNFPVALMEAMAGGAAIVTANATGCPEVVGDAALRVEPENVEEIRSSIKRLVEDDDLRTSLQAAARKRLEDRFSWDVVIDDYTTLYENIA